MACAAAFAALVATPRLLAHAPTPLRKLVIFRDGIFSEPQPFSAARKGDLAWIVSDKDDPFVGMPIRVTEDPVRGENGWGLVYEPAKGIQKANITCSTWNN